MTLPRRLDVVVVGAGPAGLAAAGAAADAGKGVLLLDQAPRGGGQVWRHRPGDRLPALATRLLAAATPPRVSVAQRATVVDAPSPHELVVNFDGRVAVVETETIVLATGAVERLLPFPGWTLPGVVGVGGLQALVKSGLSLTGSTVVLAGTGPLLLPVAAAVRKAGGTLAVIAEQAPAGAVRHFASRTLRDPGTLWQAATLRWASRAAPYRTDAWVLAAAGRGRVESVTLHYGGEERTVACDWLGAAAGLVPRTALAELLGCSVNGAGIAVDARQATTVPQVFAAGECCGVAGDEAAVVEGTIAGLAAAGATAIPSALLRRRERGRDFAALLAETFVPRLELLQRVAADTVVCRCENVRRGQIDPAWDQRQAKLWTRIAMGACQGAVCGPACHALFGWPPNAPRPPLEPPPLGAWAAAMAQVSRPASASDASPRPPAA